jgi:hypothetical protein
MKAPNWKPLINKFDYMKDVELFEPFNKGRIDLLIGMDHKYLLVQQESREHPLKPESNKYPTAFKLRLGWTVSGNLSILLKPRKMVAMTLDIQKLESKDFQSEGLSFGSNNNFLDRVKCGDKNEELSFSKREKEAIFFGSPRVSEAVLHGRYDSESDQEGLNQALLDLLEKHWKVEDIPENALTKEEEVALNILRKSFFINEEGKASVSCLWKHGQPNIENNYWYAKARVESLVKKMDQPLFDEISEIFDGYVSSGSATIRKDLVGKSYGGYVNNLLCKSSLLFE